MKLHNANSDILVPDSAPLEEALSRTTHLGVSAHQDDLEIMAYHGVIECFGIPDKWFTAVTLTDGAGSPRTGIYGDYSDEDMKKVRLQEQRTASRIGKYSATVQLGYPSNAVKDKGDTGCTDDLVEILKAAQPRVVYTHNPADKHATHVATVLSLLKAIRRLPAEIRPRTIYGCEVWRSLDWLPDEKKIVLNTGSRPNLAASLLGVYDSQISGGKRYDLATLGRWKANATYFESHESDVLEAATYAVDLSPLARDGSLDVKAYICTLMDEFKAKVEKQLDSFLP